MDFCLAPQPTIPVMPIPTIRQIARAYAISLLVWCSLSLLTGWQYRLFDESINIHSSLLDMLRLGEARGLSFALLTPPIFYLVRRYIAHSKHRVLYIAASIAGIVPFVALYAGLHWLLLPPWNAVLQRYVPRAGHSPIELIQSGFADQITIYLAIVVAAHAWVYFQRAREEELERYEYQQALVASELQALKMEIHPHFLFNTLHGISTLIDEEPRSAKKMIVKLSGLLRTALNRGGSDLVLLEDELKFIQAYLDLEKMRLGPRLTVAQRVEPAAGQLMVPQMILQPLVENAIRHGIAASRDNGWVEISVERLDASCKLTVRNSIGVSERDGHGGTGVGLHNTETRLKHLYGDEARLSFELLNDKVACATIVLPALGSERLKKEYSAATAGA